MATPYPLAWGRQILPSLYRISTLIGLVACCQLGWAPISLAQSKPSSANPKPATAESGQPAPSPSSLSPALLRWVSFGVVGGVLLGGAFLLPGAIKKSRAAYWQQRIAHLLSSGREEAAVMLLKSMLVKDPQNGAYHALLGDAYKQSRNFAQAAQSYRSAKELGLALDGMDTSYREVLEKSGQDYLKQGLLPEAIQQFQAVLPLLASRGGEPAMIHYLQGFALAQMEDRARWTEALKQLQAALKSASHLPESHCGEALIKYRLGQYEESINHCWRALDLQTLTPDAHYMMGVSLFHNGQLKAAISAYRIAQNQLQQKESTQYLKAFVLIDLGLALLESGDAKGAEAEITQAVTLAPKLVRSQIAMGLLLDAKGDFSAAKKCYESALKLNPDCLMGQVLLSLSDLSYKKQSIDGKKMIHPRDLEVAAAKFEQAMELDPHIAEAHYGIAEILRIRGDWINASIHYQSALKINASYTDAQYRLGTVLVRLGNLDEAIEAFTRTLSINPNYADARMTLTRLYNQQQSEFMTEMMR